MSGKTYIFLPDVPFISDTKNTIDSIVQALNNKYPQGKFNADHIKLSKKDNKYHAYAETSAQHEQKLLEQEIKVGSQTIKLKKCFPNHQIYINKLPDTFTKEEIESHFGKFGKINSIELLPGDQHYENAKTHSNINHCYIRYEKEQDAQKCLFSEQRHSIKNKDDLRVVRAFKIGQNDETDKRMFLKITPVVQFDAVKLENEFYKYFKKFGELREKIRIEQISNLSSKAVVTFTSAQAGEQALKQFSLNKIDQYQIIIRPFASKQNFTVFIMGLSKQVNEERLIKELQKYGKTLNCSISPSRRPDTVNAVVTFTEEESFKTLLADYQYDKTLAELFVGKPSIDIHMSARERNEYKDFKKRDKKPTDIPMTMGGGIGMGFGGMPRGNFNMNAQMGMNPQMMGMNQQMQQMNMGPQMNMQGHMGMNPNMINNQGNRNPNVPQQRFN